MTTSGPNPEEPGEAGDDELGRAIEHAPAPAAPVPAVAHEASLPVAASLDEERAAVTEDDSAG